ncbi:hypothetical protein HanRHA438_Chr02g0068351 [Helianthus annuus]|nr:hypothetical protein HanRHA438_Chr02g0068351 [Helianthus annuus]
MDILLNKVLGYTHVMWWGDPIFNGNVDIIVKITLMVEIRLILVRFIKIPTLTERETKKSHAMNKKNTEMCYIDRDNKNKYQLRY